MMARKSLVKVAAKRFKLALLTLLLCTAAVPAAMAQTDFPVDIHGFVSQGYLLSSANNFLAESDDGSFEFNEVGINFSSQLDERLRIGIQLLSRDLGGEGNNKVKLDWAYGDYHWRDWLGVRLGKVKTPFMLYNDMRDIDVLQDPVLLPQGVYDEQFRSVITTTQGGSIYGNAKLGPLGSLGWDLFGGTTNIEDDGYIPDLIRFYGIDDGDFKVRYIYGARAIYSTPLKRLRVGSSFLRASATSTGKLSPAAAAYIFAISGVPIPAGTPLNGVYNGTFWGLFAEYSISDLTLAAEYMRSEHDLNFDIPFVVGLDNTAETYYVMATYGVTSNVVIGSYYSVSYPDRDDRNGDALVAKGGVRSGAWQKDWALFTRYDITDNWLIKLEGHAIDGTSKVNPWDNPEGVQRNWFLFAAKTTVHF